MDPKPILPNMFHPQCPWMTRDVKKYIRPYTRTARPVKYYFAEFGISQRFSADVENPLAVPIRGGDKIVPKFQTDQVTPRNPFPDDPDKRPSITEASTELKKIFSKLEMVSLGLIFGGDVTTLEMVSRIDVREGRM